MTRRVRLVELALAVEGMALFRRLFEDDPESLEARLSEITRFVAEADRPPLALALEFPERSVVEGYAEWAETYDSMPNALIDTEHAIVEDLLASVPAGRALDAACGTGRLALLLVQAGHDTTGVDCTPEMLEVARRRVPGATFRLGDLHNVPSADGEYDVVTCGLALSHVERLEPAIAELARVTKLGGRVILTDMHPIGALFAGQASYQGAGGTWGFVRNHFHLHGAYLDACDRAGLRVRRCIEAPHTEATVQTVPSFHVAPEATRQALVGLPLALVWDLERVS